METPLFSGEQIFIGCFIILIVMSGLFTLIEKYPESKFSNILEKGANQFL